MGAQIAVSESDAAYTVKAELPGIDKDIDVSVDDNVVSISAKAERDKEAKDGERLIRQERYSGVVNRSFSLAADIDDGASSAPCQDGVLLMTLFTKKDAPKKRLQIS